MFSRPAHSRKIWKRSSSLSFLKEIFLAPGHDRVVTVKSRNFFYWESLVLSGFLYWSTRGCNLAAHSFIHASFILRWGLTRFQPSTCKNLQKFTSLVELLNNLNHEILNPYYTLGEKTTLLILCFNLLSFPLLYISIYKCGLSVCLFVCLFVCLSVCLYPINVKTAEPIGPKFFVGHLRTPGKVYE